MESDSAGIFDNGAGKKSHERAVEESQTSSNKIPLHFEPRRGKWIDKYLRSRNRATFTSHAG